MRATYHIRKGASQRFKTQSKTASDKIITDALAEITSICNFEWVYQEIEKRARWKMSFHNNNMMRWLGRSTYTAAGLQGPNWLAFNSQRQMAFNGCTWVVKHELGHAMGMNRRDDPRSADHVMNQTKTVTKWHADEIQWMVKRFGKPKNQPTPPPTRKPREAWYLFPGDSKRVRVREIL